MKHTLKITLFLILVFFCAQVIGIVINAKYIDIAATAETGEVTYNELPFGFERPDVPKTSSFIYIILGVLVGTGVMLLIIKFKKVRLWKMWYFLAVVMCLSFALGAFLPQLVAFILALLFAIWKILKTNPIIHNITEIFIYGGLAAIFVPILNLFSVIMLLLIISVYDMIAVWKSKHMVKLAEFQTDSKIFAGLSISYKKKAPKKTKVAKKGVKITKTVVSKASSAIIGGGDVAFPILFAAVVMEKLVLSGLAFSAALSMAMIIAGFATLALAGLMFLSKEGKFYPAMPFISLGCFMGYGIILLLI